MRVTGIEPAHRKASDPKSDASASSATPTPMKKFGEIDDLIGTLLWLSDDNASGFVTGTIIPVDGGFSAYSGV